MKLMKLIKREKLTKQVKYFGLILSVPKWTSYVGTDTDGEVWAFGIEPLNDGYEWYMCEAYCQLVATVNLEGLNWSETLVEV